MSRPDDPDDGPVIEVVGVAKRYGRTAALADVNLTVDRGEFVVLVGPSGSGKSTLLSLLAALERPDEGQITVAGHRLDRRHRRHLDRFRRMDVGLIFQLHNLVPRLTARENVEAAMFSTHHGRRARTARAAELLERLDLTAQVHATPPTMSGGERQRVAIARALANHPTVLLADEPTGSLDDVAADRVLDLFDELRSEGATILAVSHDRRLNDRASRTVRITGGRTEEVEG